MDPAGTPRISHPAMQLKKTRLNHARRKRAEHEKTARRVRHSGEEGGVVNPIFTGQTVSAPQPTRSTAPTPQVVALPGRLAEALQSNRKGRRSTKLPNRSSWLANLPISPQEPSFASQDGPWVKKISPVTNPRRWVVRPRSQHWRPGVRVLSCTHARPFRLRTTQADHTYVPRGKQVRRHILKFVPLLLALAIVTGCSSPTERPSDNPETSLTTGPDGISLEEFCAKRFFTVEQVVATTTSEGVAVSWTETLHNTDFHVYRRVDGEEWFQVGTVTDGIPDGRRFSFIDTTPLEMQSGVEYAVTSMYLCGETDIDDWTSASLDQID